MHTTRGHKQVELLAFWGWRGCGSGGWRGGRGCDQDVGDGFKVAAVQIGPAQVARDGVAGIDRGCRVVNDGLEHLRGVAAVEAAIGCNIDKGQLLRLREVAALRDCQQSFAAIAGMRDAAGGADAGPVGGLR